MSWYLRKMSREWVEKYPSIKKMSDNITGLRRMGSPATVNGYIQGIRRFIEHLGYDNPETALEKIKCGEVDAFEALNKQGSGFIDEALKKYAHNTVRGFLFGIKKWLSLNDVKLDWDKIEFPTSTMIRETDRTPTKEELNRILSHSCSLKDLVTTLILASSGLRIGTLLDLTWGDVSFDYPDIARINVTRQVGRKFSKRGNSGNHRFYATFITPEAKQFLLEYKRHRESKGEKIEQDTPLIAYKGRRIRVSAFEYRWKIMLKKAGLAERSHRWFKLHLHTLRKFFRTNCVGVDSSYREFWMGHRGGYLDESYFRADEKRHLEEYRKTIHHLSVLKEPKLLPKEQQLKVEEVNRLRKQVENRDEELQQLVNSLTAENLEYRNRMAKVELEMMEMRKALEKLSS